MTIVIMNSKTWKIFCAFVVLVFIGNVYSSPAVSKNSINHVKGLMKDYCMQKANVKQEQLDPFKGNNPAEDRDVGCYFACVLTLTRVMKKNSFDPDAALEQIHLVLHDMDDLKAKTIAQLEACKEEVTSTDGTDDCNRGLVAATCMLKVDHNSDLLPL